LPCLINKSGEIKSEFSKKVTLKGYSPLFRRSACAACDPYDKSNHPGSGAHRHSKSSLIAEEPGAYLDTAGGWVNTAGGRVLLWGLFGLAVSGVAYATPAVLRRRRGGRGGYTPKGVRGYARVGPPGRTLPGLNGNREQSAGEVLGLYTELL